MSPIGILVTFNPIHNPYIPHCSNSSLSLTKVAESVWEKLQAFRNIVFQPNLTDKVLGKKIIIISGLGGWHWSLFPVPPCVYGLHFLIIECSHLSFFIIWFWLQSLVCQHHVPSATMTLSCTEGDLAVAITQVLRMISIFVSSPNPSRPLIRIILLDTVARCVRQLVRHYQVFGQTSRGEKRWDMHLSYTSFRWNNP